MTSTLATWGPAAGALAAVVAGLLLLARGARLAGLAPAARPGRRLRVEETLALDPRRRLLLVRCDGRELLLLTGGAQDQVVGWLAGEAA